MDELTLDTLLRLLPDAREMRVAAQVLDESGAREAAMRLRDAARAMKAHEDSEWEREEREALQTLDRAGVRGEARR